MPAMTLHGYVGGSLERQFAKIEGAKYGSIYTGLSRGAQDDITKLAVPIVYGTTKIKAQPILVPSALSRMVTKPGMLGAFARLTGIDPNSITNYVGQGGQWALCQGPIEGTVTKLWTGDKYRASLYQPGCLTGYPAFTVVDGSLAQSPWSFLTGLKFRRNITLTVDAGKVTIEDPDFTAAGVKIVRLVINGIYLSKTAGTPNDSQYKPVSDGVEVATTWNGYALYVAYDVTPSKAYDDYGYGGTALLRNEAMNLSIHDGQVPEIYAEIQGLIGAGNVNPVDVIEDLLTSTIHGVGIDPGLCDFTVGQAGTAASSLHRWCDQADLEIAVCLDEQRSAAEIIESVLASCDGELCWSDDKYRLYPYAEADTGTFTAWQTPQYEINEDHLLAVPTLRTLDVNTVPNLIPVQFIERTPEGSNPAPDQLYLVQEVSHLAIAQADQEGVRRSAAIETYLHSRSAAEKLSAIYARRSVNQLTEYELVVSSRFQLLEPFDIIELTYAPLGISERSIRITTMEMLADESIRLTCTDWLGMPDADPDPLEAGDPQAPEPTKDPINVGGTFALLDPRGSGSDLHVLLGTAPATRENWGGAECWISWDGSTYHYAGFTTGSTLGQLITADLDAGPVEDTQEPEIDCALTFGELPDTTTAERDAGLRAVLIGDEVIWYGGVTDEGDYVWTLDSIMRGQEGTTISDHAIGTRCAVLDSQLLRIPITADKANATLYVKWLAENTYGAAVQELADVDAETYTIPASAGQYLLDRTPVRDEFQEFSLHRWEPIAGETNTGIPTLVTDSAATGGHELRIDGQLSLALDRVVPFNPTSVYTLTVKYRLGADNPGLKVGLYGLDEDRVTWLGKTNGTALSDQPVGLDTNEDTDSDFVLARHYWSLTDTAGVDGSSDLTAPGVVNEDTRYLGVWIQTGADADSVTEIDYIELWEEISGRQTNKWSVPLVAIVPDGDGQLWPNGHSERAPSADVPANTIDVISTAYSGTRVYNDGAEFGYRSASAAYSGSYGRLFASEVGVNRRYLRLFCPVVAGETYAFTCMIKGVSVSSSCGCFISWYTADNTYISESYYAGMTTTDWRKMGVCAIAPANAAFARFFIMAYVYYSDTYTDVYIDNIALRHVGGNTGRVICSGVVSTSGDELTSAGAYFYANHLGTGYYTIVIPGYDPGGNQEGTIIVSAASAAMAYYATGYYDGSVYQVRVRKVSDQSLVDYQFCFVVGS